MDEELIKQLIDSAIQKAMNPQGKPAAVLTMSKSASEIITEKKIKFVKDNGNGTIKSLMSMLAVKAVSEDENKDITRDDYKPTKKQLGLINKIALETQKEDSGYVITFQATNSIENRNKGIDRSGQAFSEKGLKLLAKQAEANVIPYLLASEADWGDHTWKAVNAYGYVIKAYVKDGALFYETYFPKADVTKDVLDRLFTAMLNKVSVGFSMPYSKVLCSSCENSIFDEKCDHYPGEKDAKGNIVYLILDEPDDNYEFSGVAVPCQQDAGSRGKNESTMMTFSKSLVKENLGFNKEVVIDLKLSESSQELLKRVENAIEKSDNGKILNDKNTIEDNMTEEEKQALAEAEAAKLAAEQEAKLAADLAAKTAVDTSAALLAAITELSADVKALKAAPATEPTNVVDETEVVKSLRAEVVVLSAKLLEVDSLKAEVASLKASVEADKKEYATKAELAAAKSVPGSETLNKIAGSDAGTSLGVSTDPLIAKLFS